MKREIGISIMVERVHLFGANDVFQFLLTRVVVIKVQLQGGNTEDNKIGHGVVGIRVSYAKMSRCQDVKMMASDIDLL